METIKKEVLQIIDDSISGLSMSDASNRRFAVKCLKEIREKIISFNLPVMKSLTPHRCPVCEGNGIVPNGFYNQAIGQWTTSIAPDVCRGCNRTGIVWG